MKRKLPLTAEITLESKEDQWRLLINGLIKELKTSGVITISPEHKVRVQLEIKNIIPPEYSLTTLLHQVESSLGREASSGIERIITMVSNKLEKNKWIFIGKVAGNNNASIIIIYYEFLNIFVYSQKLKEENNKKFLPNFTQN
jgi:hypothetical protein